MKDRKSRLSILYPPSSFDIANLLCFRYLYFAHAFDGVREHFCILVTELLKFWSVEIGNRPLELFHGRFELGVIHRLFHRFADGFHYRRRCSARSKQPGPNVKLDVVSKLLESGDIRQGSHPFGAPAGERPQLSRLEVRDHHRGSGGEGVDVTAEERGERGTPSGVGHMLEMDSGAMREHLHRHMQGAVDAGG